jgi:hypothetical protein
MYAAAALREEEGIERKFQMRSPVRVRAFLFGAECSSFSKGVLTDNRLSDFPFVHGNRRVPR